MKFVNSIFKTFVLSLAIVAQVHLAYAQTASILPPAKTTFVDQNGKPLTTGTVEFYIPNTSTHKTTWQDAAETIPNANPVVLDGAGRALILGAGSYRQVVKDRNGNVIWDQVTSSVGSGGGGSGGPQTGDGDLVGTIKPWAGLLAPNQYMFTYGQEISRTTYAALFTAITSTQTIFCSSGSAVLTGFTDTTNFPVGAGVETSCVSTGATTIINKTASTITLAVNAIISTNTTATIFPWGNGDHLTTFNVPDFRGLVLAGNNNMGGAASSNLDIASCGSSKDPNSIGALCGNKTITLGLPNLPPYTPTGTISISDPGHVHNYNQSSYASAFSAGGFPSTGSLIAQNTATAFTGITANFSGMAQGGTSTPFATIQPTKTSNYIIKVTPDQNSAIASGVTSLGLMTGDIACGAGLLCTGNTISENGATTLSIGTSAIINGSSNINFLYDNNGVLGELPISIKVGTTAISGGSSTNILYNNGGILGEYALATSADVQAGTAGNKLIAPNVIWPTETTTTYGTTTTFDFATFRDTKVTLTGNITTQTLTNVVVGKSGTIAFIQDGTGSRTTVWNSIFKFAGGATPTLTTTAAAVDILSYSCRTSTFCIAAMMNDVK